MTNLAHAVRSQRARSSQQVGAQAQRLIVNVLRRLGLKHVVEIPTRMRKIGGVWRFVGQAEGDIRAVARGGLSVLCEVKFRSGGTLAWSDLEKHQHENLAEHYAAGGYSMIAWIGGGAVHVLSWSSLLAMGFGPGKSITPAMAAACQARP